MKDSKETTKDSIENLLTDNYEEPKKTKKKKKNKKEKRRLLIFSSISFLLLVALIFVIIFFIPKIKLIGSKVIKLEYGSPYKESGCTATYFGEDITDKIWYEGKVEEDKLGKYIITCKVRKNKFTVSKERFVEVVDTSKPVIELVGDNNRYICPNTEYQEEGYKALDNYDGDITDKVITKKVEDGILYTIVDSSGNKEELKRTIIEEDVEGPAIKLKGSETTYITKGSKYNEAGFDVTDNCDSNLTDKVKVEGSVDISKEGTYTISYIVSDSSGNESKMERKVVVQASATKLSSSLGCGTAGTIYLTFDDGPNDYYTPTILDVLKKYGVKATFFVTKNGSDNLIKREYNEGHAVAVHTWTHDYGQIYASSEAFWNDFNKVQDRIKRLTGTETKLMRFPGGASNTVSKVSMSTLAREALSKGYNYVDWNISSGDAGGTTDPNQEYKNVITNLSKSKGNVILMHDIKSHTMKAIESIVKYGLDNGYSFAALDSNVICRHATKK